MAASSFLDCLDSYRGPNRTRVRGQNSLLLGAALLGEESALSHGPDEGRL